MSKGNPGVGSLQEWREAGFTATDLLPRIGGKALGLLLLDEAGLPIPPTFVIGSDRLEMCFELLAPQLASSRPEVSAPVCPPALRAGLESVLERLQNAGATLLMVRSSAMQEDAETDSGAGRYLSVSCAAEFDALWHAMLQVARAYLDVRPAPTQRCLAIVVQPYVPHILGGIAFTRDPITCDEAAVRIEFAPSLTDAVAGRVTGSVVIPKDGLSTSNDERADSEPLRNLAALAVSAERAAGRAVDIEWAWTSANSRQGAFCFVQCRPVTR